MDEPKTPPRPRFQLNPDWRDGTVTLERAAEPKSLPSPKTIEQRQLDEVRMAAEPILARFREALDRGEKRIAISLKDRAELEAADKVLRREGDWFLSWDAMTATLMPQVGKAAR